MLNCRGVPRERGISIRTYLMRLHRRTRERRIYHNRYYRYRRSCYYGVTFHRTRNPSRSIRGYNDPRCSAFLSHPRILDRWALLRDHAFLSSRRLSVDVGHSLKKKKRNLIDTRRSFDQITVLALLVYFSFVLSLQFSIRCR